MAVTNSFTANTKIKSADVNQNFTEVPVAKYRQDITSDSVISNPIVQSGWGYVQGNNTTQIGVTITFPTTFAIGAVVVCQIEAGYRNSPPTAVTDSADAIESVQQGLNINWTNLSLTQVQLYLNRVNNNFAVGRYYRYSWIAIGR